MTGAKWMKRLTSWTVVIRDIEKTRINNVDEQKATIKAIS